MRYCLLHRIRTSISKPPPVQMSGLRAKETLSSDRLRANPRRQALGNICHSVQCPHVAAHLHDEAGLLNQQRTMAMVLSTLSLDRLGELVVVGTQHLMQIRMRAPLPCHAKNGS